MQSHLTVSPWTYGIPRRMENHRTNYKRFLVAGNNNVCESIHQRMCYMPNYEDQTTSQSTTKAQWSTIRHLGNHYNGFYHRSTSVKQIWFNLDSSRLTLSPDLAAKHASANISPEGQQWESTGTMPIANAPTVVGYTTCLLNAQSLSRKRSIMCRASRQLLSRYLQSLKKVRPPLAAIQNAQSSLYPRGQRNLGPN